MVHLMPADGSADGRDDADLARHFALQVDSLEDVVTALLAHGLKPFQSELGKSAARRELPDASDLGFGIGTVFVADPDGNVIEFMQANRGIFAKYHF